MNGPGAYRRRPVPPIIEAIQWDGSEGHQRVIVNWARGAVSGWFSTHYLLRVNASGKEAVAGDWIVRDEQGDFRVFTDAEFKNRFEAMG